MPGRSLGSEAIWKQRGSARPEHIRRRAVLRETLDALEQRGQHLRAQANANLVRWAAAPVAGGEGRVELHAGDWGDVTGRLTQAWGERFAVLNMANAYVPGGAYVEGTAAQEENLFRRTDCHLAVAGDMLDETGERYTPEMTALLSGRNGRVYLDLERPRICLRGAEDRDRDDLGYRWLADHEVFPFAELRAAAVDTRPNLPFLPEEMRRRIRAQLATLIDGGVRHAVLSAFGCGAFGNPAHAVARLYAEEIGPVAGQFALLAFAIFHPGYGPDNLAAFREGLSPVLSPARA